MAKTKKRSAPGGLPSLGYITFASYDPAFSCTALLGDGSPTPTGGYGGWEIIPRKRRRGLTDWTGNEPLQIDILIVFDGFASNTSQEKAIRSLEKMAGLDDNMGEPPLLTFDSGGVVPHDATNASQIDWVIDDIKWGDADRDGNGNRTRQAATVTVWQFIEDDRLSFASAAQQRAARTKRAKRKGKAQRGAKQKRYVVKDQENLETIAHKELGSSRRWRDIKALNPKFRDPKKIIPIGTVITLP